MRVKRTIIPPPWRKPIALYDSLLFLLIAGFWFSVALYDFDSLCMLDIVYLGGLFSIFFLLFSFFLTYWGKLKAEKNKVLDEVPPFVWIATAFITFLLFFVVYLLFDSGKGLEQFSSGALAFVAAVAAPFAIWRITLTSKQTQTAIRQTEIQQQAEHRQSFSTALKSLNDKDINIQIGAITQLTSIAKQDKNYRPQVIYLLSTPWQRYFDKEDGESKAMVSFIFGELVQLDFNFAGLNLEKIAPSVLENSLHLTFGDAGTLLPGDLLPPDHWPKITLEGSRRHAEWEKWRADKKNYIPPEK